MKPQARQRFHRLMWVLLLVVGFVVLGVSLSNQYWIYYQFPSDPIRPGKVRVGGVVRHIRASPDGMMFDVCDDQQCISVHYQGDVPQMFGEDKEALIEGEFEGTLLKGKRVLAKHDERYERKKKR